MELLATNGQLGIPSFARNGFLNPSKPYLPLPLRSPQRPISPYVLRKWRKPTGIRAVQDTNTVASRILEKDLSFTPTFEDYVKVLEAVQLDRSIRPTSGTRGFNQKKKASRSVGEDEVERSITGGRDRLVKDSPRGRRSGDSKRNRDPNSRSLVYRGGGAEIDSRDRGEKRSIKKNSFSSTEGGRKTGERSRDESKRTRFGQVDVGRNSKMVEGVVSRAAFANGRETERRNGGERRGRIGREEDTIIGGRKKREEKGMEGVVRRENFSKRMDSDTEGGLSRRMIRGHEQKGDYIKTSRHGSSFGRLHSIDSEETLGGTRKRGASAQHESGLSRRMIRGHEQKGDYMKTSRHASSVGRLHSIDSKETLGGMHKRDTSAQREGFYGLPSEVVRSVVTSKEASRKIGKRDAEIIAGDDEGINDRAAFKTFEVFTEVRDRPRVLRMEMEERIRNLAKWLNATDVNTPAWQFSKMMHSAKIKFTDHSILRVVQILGELGNWKRVLQVVEWLESRERFKSYKSKYIYTSVLDALGKAKRPVEALNIFYTMRQEKSSYPDLAAYHCIAVTLGQAGLMKELFDVIDCMRTLPEKKFNLGLDQKWNPRLEPDLVVYNAVLNACVQKKQWEGAFWVLQQLKQQGIKPSGTTYGLVMEVMLACEKYNLVHEFFEKVEKTSIPSTLSYRVLINTLWKEGKIDEAVLAARDMEKRGIVGSASLYYDLARCLCSAGRCQEALMQMEKICKVANKPLVVTYTGLIQACLDSGNIKNAEYIFSKMREFCTPNIITCNIMLKSYLHHGMYEEAKGLFQTLLDDCRLINKKTDLRGKVVPDKFTFNAMMEAASSAGNWDDFEHAFIKMLNHGFHFDKKRHLRMIMDAVRAGKGQLLDTIWEYLVSSGRDPPLPIMKERFIMKLKEGDHIYALACLDIQHREDPRVLSTHSWLNLLKVNAENIRTDTIVKLIDGIRNLAANSDSLQPIHQTLLNVCVEFLDSLTSDTALPANPLLLSVV